MFLLESEINREMLKSIEIGRHVFIAYENSDEFYNAELIDYSSQSLRFQSETPFNTGNRIYIITRNKPIDDLDDKFIEAYFAEVIWCKKYEDRYFIGALIEKPFSSYFLS